MGWSVLGLGLSGAIFVGLIIFMYKKGWWY
jgi:hypothetical protein